MSVTLRRKIAGNAAADFYGELAAQGKATEATKASVLKWATTDMEAAKAYFDSAPVLVHLDDARGSVGSQRTGHGGSGSGDDHVQFNGTPREVAMSASSVLDARAKKRMATDKDIKYADAAQAELDADPQLMEAFVADVNRS